MAQIMKITYYEIVYQRIYRFKIQTGSQQKQNTRFGERYTCFECYQNMVVLILVNFQHRPMFSHINGKLSPRPLK